MAGKHAAIRDVPAPVPVKAGALVGQKVVNARRGTATGRHRAEGPATGRHRADPVKEARSRVSGEKSPRVGGPSAGAGRPGSNPRYTPRASRTRYIRYIGNQDATNTGKLVAEWLVGIVLISVAVPLQGATTGYQKTITTIMYRLSALTAVFFVLAFMTNGKGGRVAVYAGLLIDLGIAFTAFKEGSIHKIASAVSGGSTSATTGQGPPIVPEADLYPPAVAGTGGLFNIPDGSSGNSAGTSPSTVSA